MILDQEFAEDLSRNTKAARVGDDRGDKTGAPNRELFRALAMATALVETPGPRLGICAVAEAYADMIERFATSNPGDFEVYWGTITGQFATDPERIREGLQAGIRSGSRRR